jgi:cytochrome c-type biogenesis protein
MLGERVFTDVDEVSELGGDWFRWRHGALIISSAWLVFPYLVEGRHLLSDVGASVQDQRRARSVGIGQYLTRFADGPGEADVEVLFATPRYFEIADKARAVAEYRPDRYLVFVVSETVHVSRLPQELPTATLVVDGREYLPVDVEGPTDVEHHRATTVRFARVAPSGERVVKEGSRTVELWLTNAWDPARTKRTATWQLPITYPEDVVSGGLWTPAMLLAMSAGLLSAVFTPCLLQLIVIYLVTLTGLGAEEIGRRGAVPVAARRKMFVVALSFVTAFIALYTGAGAMIGFIGKEAQLLFAEWSRAVSIGAGILVIGLGIWVGIKARAPLVCRIPKAAAMAKIDRRGIVGPALVAAGFSLGCSACFGGAIIATLLIYVGALGSAPVGALVMFMFSLGVAIPFLLAALFLSRVMPVMGQLTKYAPHVGFASMAVIIAFGAVLVTDNFHVLSSMIYPWLGLS